MATVLVVMVNILDFNMNAEDANQAPRFYTQKFEDYLHVESGVGQDVIDGLKNMGHSVRVYEGVDLFFGGVHLITIDPVTGIYTGSADIRRGGVAIGY
jgi:gamma-glutamyltranspeptidase/glutathione hydrolase